MKLFYACCIGLLLVLSLVVGVGAQSGYIPPEIIVSCDPANVADGYIFLAPYRVGNGSDTESWLMILDKCGSVVWQQKLPPGGFSADFKPLDFERLIYSTKQGFYTHILNLTYSKALTVQAVGYDVDFHDAEEKANGNLLLIAYGQVITDLTAYGGAVDNRVNYSIIQEIEPDNTLIREWHSLDHMLITDTDVSLSREVVDHTHTNALHYDDDGNLLASNRHTDDIIKVCWDGEGCQPGEILWRLGGKRNEFAFANESRPGPKYFARQHDIKRLGNGNIQLFDNGNGLGSSQYSRVIEYAIDEPGRVVTLTREYTSGMFAPFTGNAERLDNGNLFVSWNGAHIANPANPNVLEIAPDGSEVFRLELPAGWLSYRAFKAPWGVIKNYYPMVVKQ